MYSIRPANPQVPPEYARPADPPVILDKPCVPAGAIIPDRMSAVAPDVAPTVVSRFTNMGEADTVAASPISTGTPYARTV